MWWQNHVARVCTAPEPRSAPAAASKSDDRSTRSSRSSRSSASSSSSKKSQLKSLKKEGKAVKKQFAQIKEDIRELEDSDISGSSDESATSLFIMSGTSAHFCGEQRSDEDLDLTKGWLLDCQSTCDIACNPELLVPGSLRKSENKSAISHQRWRFDGESEGQDSRLRQ